MGTIKRKAANKLSSNMEDYLEAILIASAQTGQARVVDIKNLMNVKTPSVSGALEVLAGHNLIKHERYGRVQLTKQGAQIAAEVKKKHATIALFLKEIIGVATEVADIDACKIEHAISKETFLKLANFVENFKNRT